VFASSETSAARAYDTPISGDESCQLRHFAALNLPPDAHIPNVNKVLPHFSQTKGGSYVFPRVPPVSGGLGGAAVARYRACRSSCCPQRPALFRVVLCVVSALWLAGFRALRKQLERRGFSSTRPALHPGMAACSVRGDAGGTGLLRLAWRSCVFSRLYMQACRVRFTPPYWGFFSPEDSRIQGTFVTQTF
jgi:hypothetical protein